VYVGQGPQRLAVASGVVVMPWFEYATVASSGGAVDVTLDVAHYNDGAKVSFTGGTAAAPVTFPASSATTSCKADRVLTGTQTLVMHFDGTAGKWVEDTFM
jgi:hypothetical protein